MSILKMWHVLLIFNVHGGSFSTAKQGQNLKWLCKYASSSSFSTSVPEITPCAVTNVRLSVSQHYSTLFFISQPQSPVPVVRQKTPIPQPLLAQNHHCKEMVFFATLAAIINIRPFQLSQYVHHLMPMEGPIHFSGWYPQHFHHHSFHYHLCVLLQPLDASQVVEARKRITPH